MSDIVLSAGVRQNLLSLQKTAELMAVTQNRLATGKKVNTALDNPTNFFTAASLQSRAGDLNALMDAMSNGIKTLEAADNGVTAITKTIETMQSTLRQIRQDRSFKSESYPMGTISTGTVRNLTFQGGSVGAAPISIALNTADVGGSQTTASTTAAYAPPTAATQARLTGGVDLSGGTFAQAVDVTISFGGQSVNVSLANGSNRSDALASIQTAIAGSPLNGVVTASVDGSGNLVLQSVGNVDGAITVADNGTVGSAAALMGAAPTSVTGSDGQTTFTVNGTLVTLTAAQNNVASAVTKANADLGPSHAFEAYDNGGRLGFRAKASGATALNIGGANASLFGPATVGTPATTPGAVKNVDALVAEINSHPGLKDKIRASSDNGKLRIENLSTSDLTVAGLTSGQITGDPAGTSTIGPNDVRKNLVKQFNDLRDQLDKLADDASFNGVNLLRGDKLKLTFNETGSSTLEIQARDQNGNPTTISALSLGVGELTNADIDAEASLEARLTALGNSLGQIRAQASSFGSNLSIVQNRSDFTKAMINTLANGADKLVLADTNEEGANMLALQTRQQLSTTALSLSSQADQAILRLFG